MSELSGTTVVQRGTEHVETAMAGQTVMMSLRMGRYYALDGTAQRIWDLLSEPVAVSELVARLTEEYSVDPGQCRADVVNFLTDLDANGLLERS